MTSDETRKLVAWLRVQLKQFSADLDWSPSDTVAQEYREHLTQAADALEATLPSETEGQCPCGFCEPMHGVWFVGLGSVTASPGSYCPRCGARLGPDGIARRNADTGRAEKLTAALEVLIGTDWQVIGAALAREADFCAWARSRAGEIAGRVEQVRAELDASEAQASEEQFPPPLADLPDDVDDMQEYGERSAAEGVRRVCSRIRAALDGGGDHE